MLRKSALVLFLFTSLFVSHVARADIDRTEKPADALPASVYTFSGISPEINDDSDLAPLDHIIGDAHVVALGEAIHTSGGFHDVRFRVVRHLIRDKGFRVLTLETPRLMSQPLVDFIDSCRHTETVHTDYLHHAMAAMFPVFASETMSDMLGWVCQFNMEHPNDPISFTGFDMQETWLASKAINETLSRKGISPRVAAALKDITHCAEKNVRDKVSLELVQSCSAIIDKELDLLSQPKNTGMSNEQLGLLKMNLRSLRAHIMQFYLDGLGDSTLNLAIQVRDEQMADNILALNKLYWKNKRIIVWAHNQHVERSGLSDQQPMNPTRKPFRNMGQFLSERLGEDYKTIGLLAFQLELNWPSVNATCAVGGRGVFKRPAELKLRMLDKPYLIVDTTAMRNDRNAFFAADKLYSFSQDSYGPITQEYDGLIYLQNSQAMTQVMEPACPFTPDVPKPELTKEELEAIE